MHHEPSRSTTCGFTGRPDAASRCRLPHRRDREALPIRVRMIGLSVGRLREPVRPRATFATAAQAPASAPSPLAGADASVPGTCLGAHEWDLTDQFGGPDAVVEPPSRPPQERTHDLVHEHRFGHPRPPTRMRRCADGPAGLRDTGSTADPAGRFLVAGRHDPRRPTGRTVGSRRIHLGWTAATVNGSAVADSQRSWATGTSSTSPPNQWSPTRHGQIPRTGDHRRGSVPPPEY
jgi:hypothetical protein